MIVLLMALGAHGSGDVGWKEPPEPIATILDASLPPAVSLSPDRRWMLEVERPSLPPLEELARPVVKVAGIEIDPDTHGPARPWHYRGLTFQSVERHDKARRLPVELPEGARVRDVQWHAEGERLAFSVTTEDGIELWTSSVDEPRARRLLGPVLNATYGAPCDWLPGQDGLICKVVPENLGDPPQRPRVPAGPSVAENVGKAAPARTYANLLQNPHDEALFEHYLTSALVRVGLDGQVEQLVAPALIDDATPSPDGRYVLIWTLHRPFSYSVPASRFPRTAAVLDRETGGTVTLEELPLADSIPITFGSVRTGRRIIGWRPDRPATLYAVEALDGGDAGTPAAERDAVYLIEAPFDGEGERFWTTELRFGGLSFTADGAALASEWWYTTRIRRAWWLVDGEATRLWEVSMQDRYGDPGSPLTETGPFGRPVLRLLDGDLLLAGDGISPEGVYPFLDRYDPLTGETERLWQSADPYHEVVVTMLDGERFLTRRQSREEPPNYFLRQVGRKRPVALTRFPDHAPQFANLHKEVIRYTRDDGLELSATLYLPPGYDRRKGEPLPTLFWVYPSEFKRWDDAAQVTDSPNTFSRPWASSHLFFLLQGWAVLDDPKLPILGEGDEEPNDTYVEQLVSGAEAAVRAVVDRGIADPERLVIGGHSYGAFTTANLLAHTDLFQAGIARSGAYNRSLTPFGFQGEQRSYWEAMDTYTTMSPFTHAHRIDEPLLLIHGAEDNNSGTWPMQSARLYEAMKGLGGTVRWVELPHEGHGYRARESAGHVLAEMFEWAERWTSRPGDEPNQARSEEAP